jgi:aspartate/methionine/tyrosine aminotransferase
MAGTSDVSSDTPVFVTEQENLIPVNDSPSHMTEIPPSRMFIIKKGLSAYKAKAPDSPIYDASQGDGGASLPGVPLEILERAHEMQVKQGTSYDMPYGCDAFRKSVVENYWKFDAESGIGPANVLASVGGRDALIKAYNAMLHLGYGRLGDVIAVSRVPWISYNWGPYGIGANVLLSPGDAKDGWAYSPDSIRATIEFAEEAGRKVAGLVITCPDNPTGNTISLTRQAELARAALEAGAAFVLFDWMYHTVTDELPNDLNTFIKLFSPEERKKLMFMDGITKSLGGSNIRNSHLIADKDVIDFIQARASHGVIPSFYSQAVAMAAYEMGFMKAARTIIEPTNASRVALKEKMDAAGWRYILGKGYYAFIDVGEWMRKKGITDGADMGEYLARDWGVAVVPGVYFSQFGNDWIRFSYATPVEKTLGAFERLDAALKAIG